MSLKNKSLVSVEDLENSDIQEIFRLADVFKTAAENQVPFHELFDMSKNKAHTAFLVFTEPSTRTRMSFEMACHKMGVNVVSFGDVSKTSLIKGETVEATLEALDALGPSVIILRHRGKRPQVKLKAPIINAGFGSYEHPTQALIDAWTIEKQLGKVKGAKVLIIGDVLHSRVSNSNLKLLRKLGAEVALSSPAQLQPEGEFWKGVPRFENLNEGIKWATCVMCLRIQKERHDVGLGFSIAEYRDYYLFDQNGLDIFDKKGVILHPGPYICGVEISKSVFEDPRCCIMEQVENSPHIRAAILSLVLGLKVRN